MARIHCKICKHIFYARPSHIRRGRKYCSYGCFNKGHTGFKHSQKTITLMSKKRSAYLKNPLHRKLIGINQLAEKNHGWKGGRMIDKNGYVLVYAPKHPHPTAGKYKFEHMLVVEKLIGRYMRKKEVTHHIGKNDDNQPHMLMCFIHRNAHLRFHRGFPIKPHEIIYDGRKH